MNALKAQVLAYVDGQTNLELAERTRRHQGFDDLPDELYELGEQMSPKGADLPAKVKTMTRVLTEAVKLAEAWPGEGPAQRIAAAVKAEPAPAAGPMTFAEARPDVMLARLTEEIREAEGVDYGEAMRLAEERDPYLSLQYRTMDGARETMRAVDVEPPRGMRLCETRPDVELAERGQALAKAEGLTFAEAERRLLAENPKLRRRYRDYSFGGGRSALDELAYRAHTIRAASRGRVSERKAVSAALSEDPTLREDVMAWFEPSPYQSTTT
jgi:hypothetical protein